MATAPKKDEQTASNATVEKSQEVPSLLSLLDDEEVVGAEASFVLTDELRSTIERGFKKTQENPGGWLRVRIPEQIFDSSRTDDEHPDGQVWSPTDAEAKTILSERESELRTAALQLGYSFRRQTPKSNGKEDPKSARFMLYRINPKQTKNSAN